MPQTRSYVRLLAVALLTLFTLPLAAQEAPVGRVIGRVVEGEAGAPLSGAQVEVVGTTIRAISAIDGRYTLLKVPAGPVTIAVRMIGYQPKQVTGLVVPAGGTVEQNVSLAAAVVQLEEFTVAAEAEKGSVNAALNEQRTAENIINVVTAEQIAKSPDSDAGQAVQRVSGVTVQDGKYVFVRGLGERYTTTSLNGARIPSPEQERRTVPLDLFPSNLLEGITTSKTFTADQPGDFSGAQVNLKTREFPLGRVLTFSATTGVNTAATAKDVFKAPTLGGEWLGFSTRDRALPGVVKAAGNLAGLGQPEVNRVLGAFRNSWTPAVGNGAANGSTSFSVGGEDPVFGQLVGYVASLSYSIGQEARADEFRSLALPSAGGLQPLNPASGSTARSSALWGAILNLSTRIGAGTKISINNAYTRGADNEATRLRGFNEEFNTELEVTRLTYTEKAVRSNQVAGEHLIGGRHFLDWRATSSGIIRREPDRSDLAYEVQPDRTVWFGAPRSATRTFGDLTEEAAEFAGNYRLLLGRPESGWSVKVGGLYRRVDRFADSRAYDVINNTLSEAQRAARMEDLFSPANIDAGSFVLQVNANGGRYSAGDRLSAGYGQLEIPLAHRVQLIAGARVEHDRLVVNTRSPEGLPSQAVLDNTDLLPAASLNIGLTETQNLRFSASRTLSRPEYRELSSVSFFEPLGGLITFGNPNLKRALIQNYDARWEWYPRAGEIISLGAFYKRFSGPIEKVIVAQTGAPALSFVNAESANNYGAELEVRKNLDVLATGLRPLTFFANATVMRSRIRPGNSDIASLTSADRAMVGQAPWVFNTGLTWLGSDGRFSATLLYNVVGRRIVEAGANPLPDTYEEERHLVDVSLRVPVVPQVSLRVDGRNLLDAPYRMTQGDVIRMRYKTGRIFTIGATWQP